MIQKILIRFPYLNAEWLITGKGEMFKPERHPTIFDNLTDTNKEQIDKTNDSTPQPDKIKDIDHKINETPLNVNSTELALNAIQKNVTQIILLYDDGTALVYKVL